MTSDTNDRQLPDDVEFDSEEGTYRVEHDWESDESVSEKIVVAVAAITDRGITELEPLTRTADPESLDALFAPKASGVSRGGGIVSLEFAGYEVTIRSDGTVVIEAGGVEQHDASEAAKEGVSSDD